MKFVVEVSVHTFPVEQGGAKTSRKAIKDVIQDALDEYFFEGAQKAWPQVTRAKVRRVDLE